MKEKYNSSHLQNIAKRAIDLRIAVCDDEQHFRDSLVKAFSEYTNEGIKSIEIHEFSSGEDLLSSENDYDIISLDYKMSGINGLETARELRRKDVTSKIIFATNYMQFVYEAFEVRAFRFLRKPIKTEQLYKAIDDYIKRTDQ